MEDDDSAAMLAAKMSAGVEAEMNLNECLACMPEVQNRGISGPTIMPYVLQSVLEKVPLFTLPGLRLLSKDHLLGCQIVDEHIDTAVDIS